MNKDLLELLLKMEIKRLMRSGIPFEDAAERAAERLEKAAQEAEFLAYSGEHDC